MAQLKTGTTIGGNTAWHAGNDGPGSGLDADLLDGQQGSFYTNAANITTGTLPYAQLPTNVTNTTGTFSISGPWTFDATATFTELRVNPTWNATANTFTVVKVNVTDTASNTNSLIMDLQVGGTSRFNIRKDGRTTIGGDYTLVQRLWINNNLGFVGFGTASAGDLRLYRDGAGILAQRNETNAQTLRVYGTYTDASNHERLSLSANATGAYLLAEEAGTGIARDLFLGANNITHVTVAANGNVGIGNTSPAHKLSVSGTTNISGNATFGQDVTISGNLVVSGTTVTVNTTNLDVTDAVIRLNSGQATPLNDIGILMQRYATANSTNYNVGFAWDEGSDRLIFGTTPEDGADNDLTFSTEWMTIASNGNVGIGNSSPVTKLYVNGDASIDGGFLDIRQGNIPWWRLSISGSGDTHRLNFTSQNSGQNPLQIQNDGNIHLSSGTGNVGIGNTTPASKLTIQNTLTANNTTTLEVNPTWNATANTFTAVKVNATDTASNTASLLMDLQVGGSSRFRVTKTNILAPTVVNSSQASIGTLTSTNSGFYSADGFDWGYTRAGAAMWQSGFNYFRVNADVSLGWSSTSSITSAADVTILRDAAGTLAQRGGTNAQALRVYGTYTDASNHERVSLSANGSGAYLLAEEAGTGIARDLFIGANNATVVTVAANGNVGIGTTSPVDRLHIRSAGRSWRHDSISHGHLYAEFVNSGGVQYFTIRTDNAGPSLRLETSGKDIHLLPASNVGIGNTSPANKLFVTGDIGLDGISVRDTATTTTTATTQVTLFEYPIATYDSCDLVIKAVSGGARHMTKLLVTANSTVAIATEYGTLLTGSSLYTVDCDISGSNTRIRITPASTTSTVFKASYELITT